MNEPIRILIKNDLELVCRQNVSPYDKQVFIYLEKNGVFLQDIAYISPDYIINNDGTIDFSDDTISLTLFEDPEGDIYETEYLIPIIEED